jgi:hypothetical protein
VSSTSTAAIESIHPLNFLRQISPPALMNCSFIGTESESPNKKAAAFFCARAHVPHKLFIEHQEKFRCRELLPVFWGNRTKGHETPKAVAVEKFPFCGSAAKNPARAAKVTQNIYIWSGRSGAATTKGTPSCWVNALGAACLRNNETRS